MEICLPSEVGFLNRKTLLIYGKSWCRQNAKTWPYMLGMPSVIRWHKFFGLNMDFLGAIGYDDDVWKAVRKRRPVLLNSPSSESARAVAALVDRLIALGPVLRGGSTEPGKRAPESSSS